MKIKAQRVSLMSDNKTFCRPSEGYGAEIALDVDLDDYEEIATVEGELPDSDLQWPHGAQIDYVKVGDKIYRKR